MTFSRDGFDDMNYSAEISGGKMLPYARVDHLFMSTTAAPTMDDYDF